MNDPEKLALTSLVLNPNFQLKLHTKAPLAFCIFKTILIHIVSAFKYAHCSHKFIISHLFS